MAFLLTQSNFEFFWDKASLDATTVTYLNNKYAQLQSLNNFVDADVLINPGYSSSNDAKQNPFFGSFVRDAAGSTTNTTILFLHLQTLLMYWTGSWRTNSWSYWPKKI
jgi:hypothetical protein